MTSREEEEKEGGRGEGRGIGMTRKRKGIPLLLIGFPDSINDYSTLNGINVL